MSESKPIDEPQTSILVVEDEPRIRRGLVDFLEFHAFTATEAADGPQAEALVARRRFDLILLDLMLPKISGEQLCREWRRQGLTTPIIMLTAKGQEQDKIAGLDLGADDYITKPFSLEELLARIRAVLRRTDPARSVGLTFSLGPLEVDMGALRAWRDGQEIVLSKRQARMLQVFAAHPNRVISREELYERPGASRLARSRPAPWTCTSPSCGPWSSPSPPSRRSSRRFAAPATCTRHPW